VTTPAKPQDLLGITLEDGERIVYYHKHDHGWQKPFLIVIGLLTAIAVIGLLILLMGISLSTTVYVITNRRFIIISGGKPSFIRHGAVKEMIKKLGSGGQNLYWIDLLDGAGTKLQWQVAGNEPGMPALVEAFVNDPSAAERAPTVPIPAA
jgi:hypothetical protein